ncbi:MAG: hypothetical protein LBL44_05455, partial [Treponema sp.]|nr:hypothetical protein [Treponema sp.]
MTGNTQKAFIAAHDLFTESTFPFGTGVIAETTERAAQVRSIRQPALLTKNQWYHILIPAPEYFLRLHTPLKEQPFPVLHRIMSKKSLSALFYDEYARFKWQLDTYLKDKPEEEKPAVADSETHAFFHQQREQLLALPSGNSFLELLSQNGMNSDHRIAASFFDYLEIAGIQFTDSGETRFLISNARKSVAITAIRRER